MSLIPKNSKEFISTWKTGLMYTIYSLIIFMVYGFILDLAGLSSEETFLTLFTDFTMGQAITIGLVSIALMFVVSMYLHGVAVNWASGKEKIKLK